VPNDSFQTVGLLRPDKEDIPALPNTENNSHNDMLYPRRLDASSIHVTYHVIFLNSMHLSVKHSVHVLSFQVASSTLCWASSVNRKCTWSQVVCNRRDMQLSSLTLVVSLLPSIIVDRIIILLLQLLSQLKQLLHTEHIRLTAMCVCVCVCKPEYGNGPQYRYSSDSDQRVQPQLLGFFSLHETL
jgi:hypothetical protein